MIAVSHSQKHQFHNNGYQVEMHQDGAWVKVVLRFRTPWLFGAQVNGCLAGEAIRDDDVREPTMNLR